MVYGLETVAVTKKKSEEMKVAEMKMLRLAMSVNKKDKISVVALAGALNQIESPIICLFLITLHVVRYNKIIYIKVLNFPHLRLR